MAVILIKDQILSNLLFIYSLTCIILFDPSSGVVRLFWPPFENTRPSPGYLQAYAAGVRENGGQYTHAAVWYALSLYEFYRKTKKREYLDKCIRIADAIDPSRFNDHALQNKYRREPYVLCGDVSAPRTGAGRGGWSWYTGAAGWYYLLRKKLREETGSTE